MDLTISNSEIATFKRCRRKWHLAYYRKLRAKGGAPTRGPLAIGTRVHDVVASYYQLDLPDEVKVADALERHDSLVELDVERLGTDADTIAELRKEADLSRAMLEGYFEWIAESGVDQGLRVTGVEKEISLAVVAPATETTFQVRAKLDLTVHDDDLDEEWFLDHKTVADFTTPTKTLHMDEQMLMYDWLKGLTDGVKVRGAMYNMIRKVKRTRAVKPPFFMRFKVEHSQQEIESFYVRLLGELDQIARVRQLLDAGHDPLRVAYPTPDRSCSYMCEFYHICPLIDRPQDKRGEPMIAMLYEEGNPYERYTELEGLDVS